MAIQGFCLTSLIYMYRETHMLTNSIMDWWRLTIASRRQPHLQASSMNNTPWWNISTETKPGKSEACKLIRNASHTLFQACMLTLRGKTRLSSGLFRCGLWFGALCCARLTCVLFCSVVLRSLLRCQTEHKSSVGSCCLFSCNTNVVWSEQASPEREGHNGSGGGTHYSPCSTRLTEQAPWRASRRTGGNVENGKNWTQENVLRIL